LIIVSVGLVVAVLAVNLAAAFLMGGFRRAEREVQATAPPRFADLTPAFPSPRLQAQPSADWIKLHRDSLQRLTSYGWVDRQAGIAHIPIDRATEMIVKSGLPASILPKPAAPGPPTKPGPSDRPNPAPPTTTTKPIPEHKP